MRQYNAATPSDTSQLADLESRVGGRMGGVNAEGRRRWAHGDEARVRIPVREEDRSSTAAGRADSLHADRESNARLRETLRCCVLSITVELLPKLECMVLEVRDQTWPTTTCRRTCSQKPTLRTHITTRRVRVCWERLVRIQFARNTKRDLNSVLCL